MSLIYIGQVFESLNGFKEALRNWAIVDHFEYRWSFSDSQRCKAVCVHKGCDFAVRCNAYPAKGCAKLTVLVPNHTYAGSAPIARSQASRVDWLEQVVPTRYIKG
jgi:MuDR family transposase